MEYSVQGRITIVEQIDELEISIPSRKDSSAIGGLGCVSFLISVFTIYFGSILFAIGFQEGFGTFILLLFSTFIMILFDIVTVKSIIWRLKGEEVINFSKSRMSIVKKNGLKSTPEIFFLEDIKNLRVVKIERIANSNKHYRKVNITPINVYQTNETGLVSFEFYYRNRTLANYFACGVEVWEARIILDKIKEKEWLTDKNLIFDEQKIQ